MGLLLRPQMLMNHWVTTDEIKKHKKWADDLKTRGSSNSSIIKNIYR